MRQKMRRRAGRVFRRLELEDSDRRHGRLAFVGPANPAIHRDADGPLAESMCTYLPEEKLLFSMDAFGQHYATSERFDDEADPAVVMEEAKTYYANIVMPYGPAVLKMMEALAGLEIAMIPPSHGLIWRSHLAEILTAYRRWANHQPRPKVLVMYDTMWESTAAMAQAILEGARSRASAFRSSTCGGRI